MTLPDPAERPTLSVTEACEILGVSTKTAYEMIRRDEWPTPVLHLGRAIRIPTRPLLALVGAGIPESGLTVVLPDGPPPLPGPEGCRALLRMLMRAAAEVLDDAGS